MIESETIRVMSSNSKSIQNIFIEENVENTQSTLDIKISGDFIFNCCRKFEKH